MAPDTLNLSPLAGRLLALHGYSRRPLSCDEAARLLDAPDLASAYAELGYLLETPNPYARRERYAVGNCDVNTRQLSRLGHHALTMRGYITRRDEVDACKAVRAARKAGTFGQPAECLLFA